MDSALYLYRAENELKLVRILFQLSNEPATQTRIFDVKDPETYYSAVINHCYYTIFYAAKAYLLQKGVKTASPEEHKKTFTAFKRHVESGELDVELLKIYQQALVRADTLLGIFNVEKQKRGKYTYRTLPQANQEPAQESIRHARTFFKNIHLLCE